MTKRAAPAFDLAKHVVIEDRLVPQHAYMSREAAEARAQHAFTQGAAPPAPPELVRGALSHRGRVTFSVIMPDGHQPPRVEQFADHFEAVHHECQCGVRLHADADRALGAWGDHIAELSGWDAEAVLRHMAASLRSEGEAVVLMCRCGTPCVAKGHLPDPAIALWAEHVRIAVG